MIRMTDHRIRKRIMDKQTNAGEMIENKMSSELYAVWQKKSSRHETYCILPQCV